MPQAGDIIVQGKRGLDAFPGTDLEDRLKANGIETVLAGFLTNCARRCLGPVPRRPL